MTGHPVHEAVIPGGGEDFEEEAEDHQGLPRGEGIHSRREGEQEESAHVGELTMGLLRSPPRLEQEGEQLHRVSKRLHAGNISQWEQELQDGDQEIEATELSLRETGQDDRPEGGNATSSDESASDDAC